MSEEALVQTDWTGLIKVINAQPTWSSYPFIMLVSRRSATSHPEHIYSVLPSEITNVILLERPMGSATLLSAVRWALAGRRRQFVTRDHLQKLQDNARQQALLTRELAHRVKNTIAVLQSIVTQTMRPYPDVDNLRVLIVERFAALARAHDLLLGTDYAVANFRALVERSLQVHAGNFAIDGPDVDLSPQASLSFALVLHELGTNAAKYGALRSPEGMVVVRWQVADSVFELSWREEKGPKVEAPKHKGFGSRLVQSTLAALGDLKLAYEPSGFQLAFSTSLDRLRHGVPDA